MAVGIINTSNKQDDLSHKQGRAAEYLAKLDLFKSSEPKEIYPRAVKELVVEILSALLIIFENS